MIKVILVLYGLNILCYADFMDSVADVVKATLSDEEKKEIPKVQTVGTVSTVVESKKNETKDSLLDSMVDSVTGTLSTDSKDDDSLLSLAMKSVSDTLELQEGEKFGLPSIFGFNKKKNNDILGSKFLGDIKDTGSTFYRGFKNSGESAEFMSGMMYKSSKVYNGMFHMFDDSVFNVFEDKDEKSIFDVFEKGNDILDMVD